MEIKDKKIQLYFFDESRFGTHSNIGHGWFKKGRRTQLPYNLGYKNFYLYSAVNPLNGNNLSLILPNVDTINFNIFLEEFAKTTNNSNVILVVDGASWHRSKDLDIPNNIKIIIQPPYSPELNPIEKLWQYIKRHTIKNRLFDNLNLIEDEVCKILNSTSKDQFMQICNVNYI